jgi:PAS domain S-box-containing protein
MVQPGEGHTEKEAVPREPESFVPLQRSEELYRTLVEAAPWLVWRCDARGRYTFLNRAWERTLGYRLDELLGKTLRDFQRPSAEQHAGDAPGAFVAEYEATHLSKDGREIHLLFHATAMHDSEGRVTGAQGTARDVTDSKLVEAYRECGREILQILNEQDSLQDSIRRVLAALKSRTGFDAVGIRLQSGEDYPYFVQDGFPPPFLKVENSLLSRDKRGVCRGKDGKPRLECTCGLVITGSTTPYLTPGGSFYTNDSAPLLKLTREEDPRLDPRNRCIHYGYASVGLVPIRSNGKIVGLIQLNDRRKNRFTPERIGVLEGVAAEIGEALMRKQIEAALRESERQLRDYQERLKCMAFDAAVAQERDRRRMAVDLHDSIGQTLALAQIKLSAVRNAASGPSRAALDEVAALLTQSVTDSRTLVFALSPPVLYDLGLGAGISWLAEDLQAKHGLEVTLTDDGVGALDETTAVVVFRAVRELLMNVLKHAQSLAAEVTLHRGDGYLEVVVKDDGVGFDTEAVHTGSFGLFSLREQISRVGGTVELTSAPRRGTRARVRVPLDHGKAPGARA